MPDHSLAAQHLVELLAMVSSCHDEATAIAAAVERAAETLQAEIGGLVVDGTVVAAVGLPKNSPDYDVLTTVRPGRGTVEITGMAGVATGAAMLGRPDEGMLVVARADEPFTVAEHNLIRGMARVLGIILRMLRTLVAQRRQERLMRHLYEIQRALSRRVPLGEVLRTILAAALDVVAEERGRAELWLPGSEVLDPTVLVATGASGTGDLSWEQRLIDPADPVAGQPVLGADDSGRSSASVPVHERGRTVGALAVTLCGDREFQEAATERLLLLAEHVSLALTDAKTAHDMEVARHDALTGLVSRALFHERLQDYLAADAAAGRVALLFVDLDRFKAVNDTLGHAAGDRLLVEVARRLQTTVRPGDMVGRLGGDEFAVILSPATEEHAVDVATRIIDKLSRPYEVADGATAEIGASVGVALNTSDDQSELVRRADIAMYSAKRSGRGRCVVFEDDEQTAVGSMPDAGPSKGLIAA
jgi:diguanylate cyclase (GGDEF)-like protein